MKTEEQGVMNEEEEVEVVKEDRKEVDTLEILVGTVVRIEIETDIPEDEVEARKEGK